VIRSYFAKNALAQLNQTDCENARLFKLLKQMKPKQELALINLAIQQNNISVASKFIRNTKEVNKKLYLDVQLTERTMRSARALSLHSRSQ